MKDDFARIVDPLLYEMQTQYSDISEFIKKSGIPLSFETVRRLLYGKKPVSIPTLIIISKYLGYSPAEIKKIIMQAGDRDFSALIGGQHGPELSDQEKALLEAFRKIKSRNIVADHFALIAKADNVDISA